jgi:hypothetical protein
LSSIGFPIAADLLSDEFRQEEIQGRMKTPLLRRRLSPYGDGEGNGLIAAATRATRLRLESRAIGDGVLPAA